MALHRRSELGQCLRIGLVDLGQDDQVRPLEGGYGFPQDPRGNQGPVPEGAGRVDQDHVGVPAQAAVLEGVVGDREPDAAPAQLADPIDADRRDSDGDVGQPSGEEQGLVARRAPVPISPLDDQDCPGRGPPPAVSAADDADPHSAVPHDAGQHIDERGLVRAPVGEVPHADDRQGRLLRPPQPMPVQEVPERDDDAVQPGRWRQERPERREPLPPDVTHVVADDRPAQTGHGRASLSASSNCRRWSRE